MDNGAVVNASPRKLDLLTSITGVLAFGAIALVFYLTGPPGITISSSPGFSLWEISGLGVIILGIALIQYGNWRRRPREVRLMERGVAVVYRNGNERLLAWAEMSHVELETVLGLEHAIIHYLTGKMEDRAHIYGEAALKLKERFEEWRAHSGA